MIDKRKVLSLLAIIILTGVIAGCGLFSNSRLEPGGAYAPLPILTTNVAGGIVTNQVAPDIALFIVDSTFGLADNAAKTVSKLEQDNRKLLWKLDPTIKKRLDVLRNQSWAVEQDYIAARNQYVKRPTTAGLSTMKAIVSKLQAVGAAMQTVLPKLPKTI